MCLICLFHLLNTYRLSFLKVLKEQDCEVLMAGISVHFGVFLSIYWTRTVHIIKHILNESTLFQNAP